ncbi:alpha/beta hydrolase [Peribacillus kribbensis]|uniref:alpha/beta hydrolase n=1 Tax=Peribacillus kribbensis TaxID=356658 RepID=UPI00040D5D24|nr:alpha/beta hydrolase [Peribacillus kribbensis]
MNQVLIENIQFGLGGETPLFLDIIRPAMEPDKPLPVLVFIHGGGWMGGDKAGAGGREWNASLLKYGFILVNINHRLSGTAPFPAHIHDCKAAIRWIKANAANYKMERDRIGVWGHSSGGHLAALIGTYADIPDLEGHSGNPDHSTSVQAVAVSAAPIDLLTMGGWHDLPHSPEAKFTGSQYVQDRPDLAKQANLVTYITKDQMTHIPPFLIIHGDADPMVPSSQAEILYSALEDVTFLRIKGGDHDYLGGNMSMNQVLETVGTFFKRHLVEGISEKEIEETQESKRMTEKFIRHFADAGR